MGDGMGLAQPKGALTRSDKSQARKVASDTCVRDEQDDVGEMDACTFFDGAVQSRLRLTYYTFNQQQTNK
jgi:hypothetical protein